MKTNVDATSHQFGFFALCEDLPPPVLGCSLPKVTLVAIVSIVSETLLVPQELYAM